MNNATPISPKLNQKQQSYNLYLPPAINNEIPMSRTQLCVVFSLSGTFCDNPRKTTNPSVHAFHN
ncbi:hypothetical protein V2J09_021536 [Rumex salicifolius]